MAKYWLIKSEPEVYSIDQMKTDGSTVWDKVRNYQARNYMMTMSKGDVVFFYHSNAEPAAIVGIVRVLRPLVDPSQFDSNSEYFDPKATPSRPIWHCVEVEFVRGLARHISLTEIKSHQLLKSMALVKNSRLSVQPVTNQEHIEILKLEKSPDKSKNPKATKKPKKVDMK